MFRGQDPLPSPWPYDHAYIINPETRTRCNHRPKTVATSNRSILKMWCQGWVPQNLEGTRMYAPEMIVMVSKTYLIHVNFPQYPVHCKVCMQAAINWWGGSHPCSLLSFEVSIVPLIVFVWPFVMAHNNQTTMSCITFAITCIDLQHLYTLESIVYTCPSPYSMISMYWSLILSLDRQSNLCLSWPQGLDEQMGPSAEPLENLFSHFSSVFFLGSSVSMCIRCIPEPASILRYQYCFLDTCLVHQSAWWQNWGLVQITLAAKIVSAKFLQWFESRFTHAASPSMHCCCPLCPNGAGYQRIQRWSQGSPRPPKSCCTLTTQAGSLAIGKWCIIYIYDYIINILYDIII